MSPQLEDAVKRFLESYLEHLNANTLHRMHRYFSKVDINQYHPVFRIGAFIDYQILFRNNVYTVTARYKTDTEPVNTRSMVFRFTFQKNSLKVTSPPEPANAPARAGIPAMDDRLEPDKPLVRTT